MNFLTSIHLRKTALLVALWFASTSQVFAADAPSEDAFRVLPPVAEGPTITAYLKYQTEMAWRQDEERRKLWA